MSEKRILNTVTELFRSNNGLSIYTYFLSNCTNSLRSFIAFVIQNIGGVKIKENELFFKQTGLEDVQFFIDDNGNLIIKSNIDKDFSINSDGELIMIENNSLCNEEIVTLGYGALYNFPTTQGTGDNSITSSDDWEIPSKSRWESLLNSIDTFDEVNGYWPLAGGKLKEVGTLHWETYDEGATNEYGFNAIGGGTRDNIGFNNMKIVGMFLTSSEYDYNYFYLFQFHNNLSRVQKENIDIKIHGFSYRLCNPSITTEGQTGIYTGNDGKKYPYKVIGGIAWLTKNLNETQYRDHSYISGYDEGTYTPIPNEDWVTRGQNGEGLMCYYNDDINNA